jgi:hypothetical protein
MTPEQFERWKDFSLRMARTCFPEHGSPSRAEIVDYVEDYFGGLDEGDIVCFVSWDHSTRYPEGHPYYNRRYQCPCWRCKGTKQEDCSYNCEDGHIYRYAKGPLICDDFAEWSWDNINVPGWMDDIDRHWADIHEEIFGDDDLIRDPIFNSVRGPVACCVRAGMDMASSQSGGVAGFTAGDLRRMYPEGVPEWVKGEPEWRSVGVKAVVPGVGFVPEFHDDPHSFDDIPDEQGVWL